MIFSRAFQVNRTASRRGIRPASRAIACTAPNQGDDVIYQPARFSFTPRRTLAETPSPSPFTRESRSSSPTLFFVRTTQQMRVSFLYLLYEALMRVNPLFCCCCKKRVIIFNNSLCSFHRSRGTGGANGQSRGQEGEPPFN